MSLVVRTIERIGDMHPIKALRIEIQRGGDIVVAITSTRGVIEGDDSLGDMSDRVARVEFCALGGGGGRSRHTLEALANLLLAMEQDEAEHPISK